MAPLTRATHLLGTGIFAIGYGIVRASIVFVAIAAFFGLHMPNANFATALVLIAVASISFVGIGMMTAVLPLISPEKGTQFGYVAQGLMLVVSGVYYPVSVLPAFMQWLAKISPATYALRGVRSAILDGASVSDVWGDIWPMVIIGVISVPLGIWVFRRGELHAKKHGKLKRWGYPERRGVSPPGGLPRACGGSPAGPRASAAAPAHPSRCGARSTQVAARAGRARHSRSA